MKLNAIQPAKNSRSFKNRVGRGIGSGVGKTCGRGHKGQSSRSGSSKKIGFEGGQMPLYRRLPKRGFQSNFNRVIEVRLSDLNNLSTDKIDIFVLKEFSIVPKTSKRVKIILSGKINRKLTIVGIKVTKGAKIAIEKSGGTVITVANNE